MDLWGAQRIAANHPKEHYDIGSRIDGFVSHMLLFPDIKMHLIDIRPLKESIPGVFFKQADATNLDGIEDCSLESLSALCSLEHFGLGRYGDPVDPEACFKAFKATQRVVKHGGYIYLSLPVGYDRLCFNAHRVFSPKTLLSEYDQCECVELTIIDMSVDSVLRRIDDPIQFEIPSDEAWVTGLFIFRKK